MKFSFDTADAAEIKHLAVGLFDASSIL